MTVLALSAELRTVQGKKVKTLRKAGQTPVVLYGHGIEPTTLSVPAKPFSQIWKEAGSSQLIDLMIDGKPAVKVLVHDIQEHPVTSVLLHADLYQVKMTEKLETEIPLKFIGEAPAVKDLEGNLITEKDSLEIRCLPGDLVPEFEVDISVLATFDDVIKVADVKVPASIEVLNDPEETVALVTAPRSEEELEAELAEPVATAEAEAIEKMTAEAEAEKALETAEKESEQPDNG
ncbi:MAG: 50S ribosomal protein L25 [Patescibacteria group bacterium]